MKLTAYEKKVSVIFGVAFILMIVSALVTMNGCGANTSHTTTDAEEVSEVKEVTVPERVTKYVNEEMQRFIKDGFETQLTNELTYHFKEGYHLGSPFVAYSSEEAEKRKDFNDLFYYPIFDENGKMILTWLILDIVDENKAEYKPSWSIGSEGLDNVKDTYSDGKLNEYLVINPHGYDNICACKWEKLT